MDNRKTGGKIQLRFTFIILAFLALWICTLSIVELRIGWLQWATGVTALTFFFWFWFGGFFYIDLSVEDKVILLKFYNCFPFAREFKMYNIPVAAFEKHTVTGLDVFKRTLTIYQRSSGKMAKYPPIYITAFNKKDLTALNAFFDDITK